MSKEYTLEDAKKILDKILGDRDGVHVLPGNVLRGVNDFLCSPRQCINWHQAKAIHDRVDAWTAERLKEALNEILGTDVLPSYGDAEGVRGPVCTKSLAKRMLDRLWGLLDGVGGPPRAIDLQRAINDVLMTQAPRVELEQAEKIKAALVYASQGGPWTDADLCKALNDVLPEAPSPESQSRESRALRTLIEGLCTTWVEPRVAQVAAEAKRILEGK